MKIFNLKAGDKIWTFRRHHSVVIECPDFREEFLTPIELIIQEICVFFDASGEPCNVSAKLGNGWVKITKDEDEIFLTQKEASDWIKTKVSGMRKEIETRKMEVEKEYQEKLGKIAESIDILNEATLEQK